MNFPTEYAEWLKTNRSIISFSVKNGIDLLEAEKMLNDKGVETFRFYEPDYGLVTAIGLVPSELARKLTSSFRLTRENTNTRYIDDMIYKMKSTEQMEGLSVYDHGIMVNDMYNKIIDNIDCLDTVFDKVPKWLSENSDYIKTELEKFDKNIIETYLIMHDIGKVDTLTIDENGRRHFPNHTQVSHDVWLELGGNEKVAKMMLHDMDFHLLKNVGIPDFMKNENFLLHMVVSFAEVVSNSFLFGGFESTSFKIKFKQLEKRGNAIFKLIEK